MQQQFRYEQTDRQTEGGTDRQTHKRKTECMHPLLLWRGGIITDQGFLPVGIT